MNQSQKVNQSQTICASVTKGESNICESVTKGGYVHLWASLNVWRTHTVVLADRSQSLERKGYSVGLHCWPIAQRLQCWPTVLAYSAKAKATVLAYSVGL